MKLNTLALLQIAFSLGQDKLVEGLNKAGFTDIRYVHGKAFAYIDRENGSQLVELARKAKVSKQFMSQLIHQIENMGYMTKTDNVKDKRSYLVKLTAKGKKAVKAADQVVTELEESYEKLLEEENYILLRTLLSKLCMNK
ncbi:MAG: winged helix DNA-binding protein [Saprospiraceae bacterium]|nr:winged helix DNA-binding protein [Saprospiraceae bacterium]